MTHRTFISLILASALAITGVSAAPARAGDDDIAKWIAGVAALAIIGAAIADNDRDKKQVVTRNRGYNYNKGHGHRHNYNHGHGHKHGYAHKQNFHRYKLPVQCRRDVQTRKGYIRGFGRHCLLKNYGHFNSLPHQCAVKTRDYSGNRRVVYSGRCLGQHGYRVAGKNRR